MKTVNGKLVSTKPIFLSNAAKYISRFYSSDNEASIAVNVFLDRATNSFNSLVDFHKQIKGFRRREIPEERERKWENEVIVKSEQSPYGIARKTRKEGKKSEDFEQVKAENEVIVKIEGNPDVEKKRKKKKKNKVVDEVGNEEKQEIVAKNALVDGGNLEMKDDKKEETEQGGKKRKHREALVGEDSKNMDMADDQSGKKKKKKRRIEGEGK